MDSTPTAPVSTPHLNIEDDTFIVCGSAPLENIAEKLDMAINKAAKERNLDKSTIVRRLPPIDICVFRRVGKSELIKAITHLYIPTSAQIDHVTHGLTEAATTIGELKFRFLGHQRYRPLVRS